MNKYQIRILLRKELIRTIKSKPNGLIVFKPINKLLEIYEVHYENGPKFRITEYYI